MKNKFPRASVLALTLIVAGFTSANAADNNLLSQAGYNRQMTGTPSYGTPSQADTSRGVGVGGQAGANIGPVGVGGGAGVGVGPNPAGGLGIGGQAGINVGRSGVDRPQQQTVQDTQSGYGPGGQTGVGVGVGAGVGAEAGQGGVGVGGQVGAGAGAGRGGVGGGVGAGAEAGRGGVGIGAEAGVGAGPTEDGMMTQDQATVRGYW